MDDPILLSQTPAIVVGACGHGLALVRGLHARGVPVLVLEARLDQPGAITRLAEVVLVDDINGPRLIDALLALRKRLQCPDKPVLFLTNDTMVRTVGAHWERLDAAYSLSWSHAREPLVHLLEKSALESRCAAAGLRYPSTFVLRSSEDVPSALAAIPFPIIVKPARPLSHFKTSQPASLGELHELVQRYASDLPFLVQQFIPGDDRSIYFSALYLDRGKVLARFDGHKLRSRPLGHTSIAESCPDDAVHAETCRFFEGLGLSGPVSLEVKRDGQGGLWVIEPTVGRTDFWVGLCIANGVNLPFIEYCHQTGTALPTPIQQDQRVWFNEDRDPLGGLWFAGQPGLHMGRRRPSFLYLHANDLHPAWFAVRRITKDLLRAVLRRCGRILRLRRS